MVQPIDQGAIIRSGMAIVPDYASQIMQQQQMQLAQSQQRLAEGAFRQEQTKFNRKIDREDQYQIDLAGYLKTGNPQDLVALMAKYPEQSEALKRGFDAQNKQVAEADLRQAASMYSYIRAGKADLAAKSLRDRITRERQAGQPDDPQDVAILEALESGDPARVKEAEGLVGMMVAVATGPDNFSKTYGDMNPEAKKDALQKKVEYLRSIGRDDLAESVLAQEDLVVVPGNGIYQGSSFVKGGGQASGGGAAPPQANAAPIPATGQAIEQTALGAVPGVVVTSRKRSPEKNAAVGGAANSFHLTDQARDFVPPKGKSMGALAMQLKKAFGSGFDVINEGDHVHVEPSSRGPVKIKSKQQFDKLASGTVFIAPDGTTRRKP